MLGCGGYATVRGQSKANSGEMHDAANGDFARAGVCGSRRGRHARLNARPLVSRFQFNR